MDEQHSDLDELQGSGFGVETWSTVIELRRSYTALKVNPNQIARALHHRRARARGKADRFESGRSKIYRSEDRLKIVGRVADRLRICTPARLSAALVNIRSPMPKCGASDIELT